MKLFVLLAGLGGMVGPGMAAPTNETVLLLHGCGRTSFSMSRLAEALEGEGYRVINVSYPSRTQPLETLATQWLPALIARMALVPAVGETAATPRETKPPERLHFVTHSMGGLLLRFWLREYGAPANLGRVVMLAPPNAGSEIPDRFAGYAAFRWFTGVNGHRLGTGAAGLPRSLGPWPVDCGELGIIAGARSLNPLLAAALPRPNDGKVSVAATHLPGQRDHLVLPFSHTWLGWRRDTLTQVKAFLRAGAFQR